MRSRRHKLQVSTFPFLAVLLCAMGALLLVLLVMDRRAHDAARARAGQAARRAAEETARDAAARRDALEQARQAALAASLQERDEEHARLVSQAAGVQGQLRSVDNKITQIAGRVRAEQADEAALKQQTRDEQARATAEGQALRQVHADEAKQAAETEASRRAREQMTADLAQLERTLADLKAARDKGGKTYSVVPYNGKRGDNRRPLYIECAAGEVIFHPDRAKLEESHLASDLQPEVERRLAWLKDQLPAAQAAAFSPYLMLLVRPDGVVTYYRLRDALRALKIDFGYELIDKDWALDFPPDDLAAPSQAWMAPARPSAAPPSSTPVGPPLHGMPAALASPGPATGYKTGSPKSDKAGAGVASPDDPAGPGLLSSIAMGPKAAPPGPPIGPVLGPSASSPARGAQSSKDGVAVAAPASPTGPGVAPPIALGPQSLLSDPPAGPDAGSPATPPSGPARQGASPAATLGPSSAPVVPSVGPDAGPAATSRSPAAPDAFGPAKDGPRSVTPNGTAKNLPPVPSPATAGKEASKATAGDKPAPAGKPAAADNPDDDPFLRAPPSPLPNASRPAPSMRPARLNGDRDWILYVECKPEGVVLYPTQLLVPVSALSRQPGANPLLQNLQQLIDRKQATVRSGDPPYRPEVRFLVHPNALRTYHLAYPTLDALAVPKTAHDLGPDDDVLAIVAGH
jgi:hypothetical protein